MLSRLNPRAGSRGLLKCIGQFQVPAASTSSVVKQNQSTQRDLVNFPKPTRYENIPEVRLGIVPKSWFDFLYPKTGVTGPYMLLTGMGVYLFSKELIVIDHEFPLFLSALTSVLLLHKVAGPKVRAYLENLQAEFIKEMDHAQIEQKEMIQKSIESIKEMKHQGDGMLEHLPEAKRENVYLQMEAAYRTRMLETYAKVKNHLDYQIEKQSVERRIAQKNMVDYVIRNVEASISQQLKTSALKQCISDLKTLSVKA